ncbi:Gamma-glutamyltransferase [Alteripontixanthobacter maritimus]|uniref:Glutathione hydrolase proenzyme n=1 Tax=Alteripontixanthobacter maritimus TaxID=2161824 RepID=A0A369QE47_9SPHN|nr:gamma-glutamyltransferase [Alteripontixanthobacter maritimus]RDC61189.1 Gamma-glutamyltransferase [Alteripontixanthobacter maritimus]
MKALYLALAALPLLGACATIPAVQPDTAVDTPSVLATSVQTREQAAADPSEALVSAADPRAAGAGAKILRQGGSATDAAIATMLALTVVEPQSSGIGGGGFYVRGNAAGDVITIDGREKAPAAATPAWFTGPDGTPLQYRDAVLTGLSVGVPGNVALAANAHRRFGKLAWADLFAPAIALAEGGFEVTPRFHEYLGRFKDRAAASAFGRSRFFTPVGDPLPVGTKVRNPQLAETLRAIATGGAAAFYEGTSAADLADVAARATPRAERMTAADLAQYAATPRAPVCGQYRAYRVCGMGPPSSGATTVYAILKQLERFDLASIGANSATFWHLFAESQRLAYADRERYLADDDFVAVPVGWLTDANYLASRSALISPDSRMSEVAAGVAPGLAMAPPDGDEPPEYGTSHFVTRDPDGNAVSYTSTIEGPFGSGLTFGGFYLNNELTDFSFVAEQDGRPVANRVEGGKRPRSSMAPTLVYGPDGSLLMAVGAAGGGTIPVQTAKAIIAAIDFGLPASETLAFPMLYSPGDTIVVEEGTSLVALTSALEALGHTVTARALPLKANAIICEAKGCIGAADPRSEGATVSR